MARSLPDPGSEVTRKSFGEDGELDVADSGGDIDNHPFPFYFKGPERSGVSTSGRARGGCREREPDLRTGLGLALLVALALPEVRELLRGGPLLRGGRRVHGGKSTTDAAPASRARVAGCGPRHAAAASPYLEYCRGT